MIQETIERFNDCIDRAKCDNDDMDAVSWSYQEGILISYNNAKEIVDQLTAKEQTIEKLKEGLAELVRLKDIKDELDLVEQEDQDQVFVNRYAQYVIDKKFAWAKAKQLLQSITP